MFSLRARFARKKHFLKLVALLITVLAGGLARAQFAQGVIYNFTGASDGGFPAYELISDAQGNLYGVAEQGGGAPDCFVSIRCGVVFELIPPAFDGGPWTQTVLYAFTGGVDGRAPNGALIFDPLGNLYGVTDYGGDISACVVSTSAVGCGVIFELSPPAGGSGSWTESVLYAFTGGADGAFPNSALVFDSNGNLYATAQYSGDTTACPGTSNLPAGCGTVVELSPPASGSGPWTEKTLYSFAGGGDGAFPTGGVVFDARGSLYGTTEYGGIPTYCSAENVFVGCGVVFELSPPASGSGIWTETVLHSFSGSDGFLPFFAGLTFDAGGNIYGSTYYGGYTSSCDSGCGVAFRLSSPSIDGDPWAESVLHTFGGPTGPEDGTSPWGRLSLDCRGNIYGATEYGGPAPDYTGGTIFQISPPASGGAPWTETLYYPSGWATPGGGLLFDAAGNLFGTGENGGGVGGGVVYELFGPTGSATTTAISVSPSTVTAGSSGPVAMSATVIPTSSAGWATGTVSFLNGTKPIGTATVNGCAAAVYDYDPSTLPAGTYSITATYEGNANFTGSTSPAQTLTVVKAAAATALGLSPSSVSAGASGPVVLTATVTAASGSDVPSGTVSFLNGGNLIGTATLASGTATFDYNPSALAVGSYSITATYSGDSNFTGSTSAAKTLTVVKNSTIADVTLSPGSVSAGASGPVVVTATVKPASGSDIPSGTVSFLNGSTSIGTAALSGGVGILHYDPGTLAVGSYEITASYGGDSDFGGSTSPPQVLTVSKATVTTVLTASPATVIIGASGPVVLTATVAPVSSSDVPTGTVSFSNGSTPIGTATVSSGAATIDYNPSALAAGTYAITATYGGDATFGSSTSPVTNLGVQDFKIAASPASIEISSPGQGAGTTLTITSLGGFSQPITFTGASCTGLPTGATCSFSPETVTPGGGAATTTLTIATSGASASLGRHGSYSHGTSLLASGAWGLTTGMLLGLVLPLSFALKNRGRQTRTRLHLLTLLALALLVAGCGSGGGGNGGGTPAGTYTITVTAASSGLSHAATLTLNVR